jgi:hypothetical protein
MYEINWFDCRGCDQSIDFNFVLMARVWKAADPTSRRNAGGECSSNFLSWRSWYFKIPPSVGTTGGFGCRVSERSGGGGGEKEKEGE